jgi:CRISPR/Cas system endoribonuclease Cas6 (RAMP superfamily)
MEVLLMRIWDAFSDSKVFGEDGVVAYKDWLKTHVWVSAYGLRAQLAEMGKKKAVGFTGWAEYEMDEMDDWNKATVAHA